MHSLSLILICLLLSIWWKWGLSHNNPALTAQVSEPSTSSWTLEIDPWYCFRSPSINFKSDPVSSGSWNIWLFPFPSVQLLEYMVPGLLGWRNLYRVYLPWYFRALPLGDLPSLSVSGFQVGKLAQIQKPGKGLWLFIELTAFSLLFIHPWFLLNVRLNSTLVGYPSILPLGRLCSINHLHNSLWVRLPWLPLRSCHS